MQNPSPAGDILAMLFGAQVAGPTDNDHLIMTEGERWATYALSSPTRLSTAELIDTLLAAAVLLGMTCVKEGRDLTFQHDIMQEKLTATMALVVDNIQSAMVMRPNEDGSPNDKVLLESCLFKIANALRVPEHANTFNLATHAELVTFLTEFLNPKLETIAATVQARAAMFQEVDAIREGRKPTPTEEGQTAN